MTLSHHAKQVSLPSDCRRLPTKSMSFMLTLFSPLGQRDVVWLDLPVAPVLVQVVQDLESIRTSLAFITGKHDH